MAEETKKTEETKKAEEEKSEPEKEEKTSEQNKLKDEKKTEKDEKKELREKKIKSILTEFKDFISRGNVVDMAVGLIVGSAFTAIVKSLVEDIITPIIGMILAGVNFSTLGITIPWGNKPFIGIGNFINAVITFLITAACVFIIVKFMNIFRKKKDDEPKEEPKPTKEEELLTEIRDLLKQQGTVSQEQIKELDKKEN